MYQIVSVKYGFKALFNKVFSGYYGTAISMPAVIKPFARKDFLGFALKITP